MPSLLSTIYLSKKTKMERKKTSEVGFFHVVQPIRPLFSVCLLLYQRFIQNKRYLLSDCSDLQNS